MLLPYLATRRAAIPHRPGCYKRQVRNRGASNVVRCEPTQAPPRAEPVDSSNAEEAFQDFSSLSQPTISGIVESPLQQDQAKRSPPKPRGLWEDVGPLLKFAIPTLCIAVTSPLMSLVDTSVVGLHSSTQLAAMSPATSVCDGIYYMMTFIPMAVTNLVSLHMARKGHRAAGGVVSQALAFSTCLCITISALLIMYSPNIFSAMGNLSIEMIDAASGYVRACAPGLPFAVCNAIMSAFFLACRAPRIPMTSTAAAALINLCGDLLLCRVFSYGAVGAAAATSAANMVVFFFLLHKTRQKLPEPSPYAGIQVPVAPALPHAETVRTLVALAGPILGVLALKVLLFTTISVRAVGEGMAISAGHRIMFGNAMLFGIFGETICNAAQAFLPPLIGSPTAAWGLIRALSVCALVIGLFNATVGAGIAWATLPLFTTSSEVVAVVTSALPLLSLQGLLHAVSMGTEGVLLAARDGWFLLASYGLAFVALNFLLDVTLGWGWGLRGCWVGSVGFMTLRLAMNSWRLLRPKTILSSTEPLSDNSSELKKRAELLARSAASDQPSSASNSNSADRNGPWTSNGAAAA